MRRMMAAAEESLQVSTGLFDSLLTVGVANVTKNFAFYMR